MSNKYRTFFLQFGACYFIETCSTVIPIKAVMAFPGMLKVNNDGTGLTIVCPSFYPAELVLLWKTTSGDTNSISHNFFWHLLLISIDDRMVPGNQRPCASWSQYYTGRLPATGNWWWFAIDRLQETSGHRFLFQLNASLFKPFNGILCKEMMKCLLQKWSSSWVFLHHISNTETGVCNIASASATHFHFAQ